MLVPNKQFPSLSESFLKQGLGCVWFFCLFGFGFFLLTLDQDFFVGYFLSPDILPFCRKKPKQINVL